jgi:hypothetical protein
MGFRLAASAGSDFPYGCHIGDQRCYVHTGRGREFDVDAWFEGHRTGRTFVTQGPLVEFRVDDELPGALLKRNAGDTVKVRINALGHPDIGAPKTVSLIQFGRTLHTAESQDAHTSRLSGEWTVPVERSCWLAARVDAHNRAVAHTSPVYIVVDDRPTFDPAQLRGICEVRLHRLATFRKAMDAMIREFNEHGPPVRPRGRTEPLTARQTEQLLYQQWGKMLSIDRDAMLDRLQRAEAHYQDLLKRGEP